MEYNWIESKRKHMECESMKRDMKTAANQKKLTKMQTISIS